MFLPSLQKRLNHARLGNRYSRTKLTQTQYARFLNDQLKFCRFVIQCLCENRLDQINLKLASNLNMFTSNQTIQNEFLPTL